MNLYKISQNIHNGYDTFGSAVVAAVSADRARDIHPDGTIWDSAGDDERICSDGEPAYGWAAGKPDGWADWANDPDEVSVSLIGTASEGTSEGVILASFRAG